MPNSEGCDHTGGSGYCEGCHDAIAAAAKARDYPDHVIEGDLLGECPDCGHRFRYATPGGIGNLDPCPDCGSMDWEKAGHVMPDGTVVPVQDEKT